MRNVNENKSRSLAYQQQDGLVAYTYRVPDAVSTSVYVNTSSEKYRVVLYSLFLVNNHSV